MKGNLLTIIIILCSVAVQAQNDPLSFQQAQLRSLVNPAATGKGGDINAALNIRQQWIGFQGISTKSLMVQGFANTYQSGLGLRLVVDEFGPSQTKNIKFNYAFFVPFEEFAFLSLGLGAGVMSNVYNVGHFFWAIDGDPRELTENLKRTIPDFDFGMELNTRNFELGGAISHVYYGENDQQLFRIMRNYYAYTRIKVLLNKHWDFIPGITWHYNRGPSSFEVNAGVRFENNLTVNVLYRNPMSLGMIVGLTLIEGFRLAYSYDYGIDNLSAYNSGSHEITISYNIPMNTSYIGRKLQFFKWKMF